jgi:radical SAM superfamily enzyme YgiQ (UPF0313 family)
VTIHDGIAEPCSFEHLEEKCRACDAIGISVVSTYAVRAAELLRHLKDKLPDVPLIVGGPHVTALPESLFQFGADYAVIGEGERTLLELVEALAGGNQNPELVPGLCFMNGGQVVRTPKRELIMNLDEVPLPARHLLPMHLYSTSSARSKRYPSHSMLASRGCPGVCTFCSKMTFGAKARYFSLERIVAEFRVLKEEYGAKDIAVWDDNFTANQDLAVAVCERLVADGFGLPWSVEARVDCVSPAVLSALKTAGCECIAYGLESGSQRMLDSMNKRILKRDIARTIEMTKKVGLAIRGYFMIGLPGETMEDMLETIKFALELDIELATFTLFVPLPGTVAYRQALKVGTFKDPEYYFHRVLPEFNLPDEAIYVPEGMNEDELLAVHKKAYSAYYFRPIMFWRHFKGLRSISELRGLVQGLLTLLANHFSVGRRRG